MNRTRGRCLSCWKAEEGSGSYRKEQALLAPAALCI